MFELPEVLRILAVATCSVPEGKKRSDTQRSHTSPHNEHTEAQRFEWIVLAGRRIFIWQTERWRIVALLAL
jgi:hypothetical protein